MARQQTDSDNRTPNKSGTRKRMRLAAAGMLALTLWAGATAYGQMGTFQEKSRRLDALESKLDGTKKVHDTLKREIDRLNDKEYREELARKDLHLSKPGETVFDVPRQSP